MWLSLWQIETNELGRVGPASLQWWLHKFSKFLNSECWATLNLSCWKFCQSIFLTNFRKVAFVLEGFLILPNVTRNIQIFCFYFERKRRVHCLANLQFGDDQACARDLLPGNLKWSSFPKSPDHLIENHSPAEKNTGGDIWKHFFSKVWEVF